jgi:hypothetical protein
LTAWEKIKNLFEFKKKEYELLGEETEYICFDCLKKSCFLTIWVGVKILFLALLINAIHIFSCLMINTSYFSLTIFLVFINYMLGINLIIDGTYGLLTKKEHIKRELLDKCLIINPPKEIGWEIYGKEAEAISREEFNKTGKSRLK